MERDKPKDVIRTSSAHKGICPNCGEKHWRGVNYCHRCGQRLNWEAYDGEE